MFIALIVAAYVISIAFGGLISYKHKNLGLLMPFTLGSLASLLIVISTTYLSLKYLI